MGKIEDMKKMDILLNRCRDGFPADGFIILRATKKEDGTVDVNIVTNVEGGEGIVKMLRDVTDRFESTGLTGSAEK